MRITTLPTSNFSHEDKTRLNVLTGLLTLMLAGVFIVAGVFKWTDPIGFQISVLHLDFFPEGMVTPLVYGIPVIEVLLGLICLTVRFREVGCYLLLLLTVAYTVLLLAECLRGISPGCGCFGSQSAHWPYWALFTRNFGLLAIEFFLIRTNALRSS